MFSFSTMPFLMFYLSFVFDFFFNISHSFTALLLILMGFGSGSKLPFPFCLIRDFILSRGKKSIVCHDKPMLIWIHNHAVSSSVIF